MAYNIYKILSLLFRVIYILLTASVLFSWLNIGTNTFIGRFVYEITEPILYPIRKLLYKIGIGRGMLDFSVVAAILLMEIILNFVRRLLI